MSLATHVNILATAMLGVFLSGLPTALAQGSLNPPGAPAPTMKTLDQIEPRTPITLLPCEITNSGSYYLVTNLTGRFGFDGITVSANDVSIDLCGFTLTGFSGNSAIHSEGVIRKGLVVRNGNLRGWSHGVNGQISETSACYDLMVAVSSNGIYLAANSLARDCRIENQNGYLGIAVGINSTIAGCNSEGNINGVGISVGGGSSVENCAARSNGTGFSAGSGSTLRGCSAYFNGSGGGISTGNECSVIDCAADSNSGTGISVSHRSVVAGCSAKANSGGGIGGVDRVRISDCACDGNGTGTGGIGININNHGSVRGCTATLNRNDGIRVTGDCIVADNLASGNGQGTTASAGIRCLGSGNRFESNNVRDNLGRGIWADSLAAGNIIIRNSAGNNSSGNYIFPAGTIIGATNSISGTITDNNPWRNFTF